MLYQIQKEARFNFQSFLTRLKAGRPISAIIADDGIVVLATHSMENPKYTPDHTKLYIKLVSDLYYYKTETVIIAVKKHLESIANRYLEANGTVGQDIFTSPMEILYREALVKCNLDKKNISDAETELKKTCSGLPYEVSIPALIKLLKDYILSDQ